MLPERVLAKKKILQALRLAEKLGCKIVGLGALTASVTKAGTWLIGRTELALTTGNAYTAAVTCEAIEQLIARLDLKDPLIAVVGCYGNIGEALTKLLGKRYRLMLIGRAEDMLFAFLDRMRGHLSEEAAISTDLRDIQSADIVITATNNSSLQITPSDLKPGAIVYDVAQPPNAPDFGLISNVLRADGGYVRALGVELKFPLGTPQGVIFACLAETILQALEGDARHHVGPIDLAHVLETKEWARRHGFHLAPFSSSNQIIPDGKFDQLKEVVALQRTIARSLAE